MTYIQMHVTYEHVPSVRSSDTYKENRKKMENERQAEKWTPYYTHTCRTTAKPTGPFGGSAVRAPALIARGVNM